MCRCACIGWDRRWRFLLFYPHEPSCRIIGAYAESVAVYMEEIQNQAKRFLERLNLRNSRKYT